MGSAGTITKTADAGRDAPMTSVKSDLNFEVWRQLASAGVTIRDSNGPVVLGLQFVTTPKHQDRSSSRST